MNKYASIEFVCVGNSTRSVMAHAIAQRYVDENGLSVAVSSSGIHVNSSYNMLSPSFLLDVGRRVIGPTVTEETVAQEIHDLEKRIRDGTLATRGYALPKSTHDQTIPHEVDVVLAVVKKYAETILEIYRQSGFSPVIDNISDFSGVMLPFLRFEDTFNPDTSLRYFDALQEAVPRCVDRLVMLNKQKMLVEA